MGAMCVGILCGRCWITGSGIMGIQSDLGCTMWTLGRISQGFQRILSSGSQVF